MLTENKFSKYLLYAIGEIVLVVIGILIALQINNWNENKKKEKESYNQLLEVQKEILNNIEDIDTKANYYREKLRDVRRIFSDTLVIEDYQENPRLFYIMTSYDNFLTQNEAFNKLVQNADNLPDQYKPIVLELKKLYNTFKLEGSLNSLINLSDEYSKFSIDFAESTYRHEYDLYHQFVLTNKEYRNWLARFSYTLDDVAQLLVMKQYEAIELYRQMVALGFPNKDMPKIEKMYLDVTADIAQPFLGRFTNAQDTLSIQFKNENLVIGQTIKLSVRDTSTLYIDVSGSYLEFNADKSKFYVLMSKENANYNRIPEND